MLISWKTTRLVSIEAPSGKRTQQPYWQNWLFDVFYIVGGRATFCQYFESFGPTRVGVIRWVSLLWCSLSYMDYKNNKVSYIYDCCFRSYRAKVMQRSKEVKFLTASDFHKLYMKFKPLDNSISKMFTLRLYHYPILRKNHWFEFDP